MSFQPKVAKVKTSPKSPPIAGPSVESSPEMSVHDVSDVIRIVQESNKKVLKGIFDEQIRKEREWQDQMAEMKKQISELSGVVASNDAKRQEEERRRLEEELTKLRRGKKEAKDDSGRFPVKKSKPRSSEKARPVISSPTDPPLERQTRSKTGKTKAKKPYTPDPSTDEEDVPLSRKRKMDPEQEPSPSKKK